MKKKNSGKTQQNGDQFGVFRMQKGENETKNMMIFYNFLLDDEIKEEKISD